MADFQFNTNLGPAAQPGTSLADMINTARGAQAYQQQQQLNPLQLQKAQMEIQQAQQINPLEVQAKQMAIEQSSKLNPLAVRKASAETGASELGLNQKQAAISHEMFGGLRNSAEIKNAEKDPQAAIRAIMKFEKLIENSGVPPEKIAPVSSYLINETIKNPKNLVGHLESLMEAGIGASNQVGLVKPSLSNNAAGQAVAANPVTGQYNVMGTPQTNPMSVRSQTFTDPVTGNIVQAPVTPQGTLGTPSNLMSGNGAPGFAPQSSNSPQAVPTGSTAETERGRATQAINNYVGSVNALTDASKPGHIPTQEFIAKKLLTYLKDPQVNTGPIADVLAGKSNQASLTSKEQEVLKLIQQRIQNLNPRTDADAQSKKDAYGSFRLKKDALADLIRQDIGNIQNQKLLANGTMKAAGDPRNPNLPAVTNFQAQFKDFSKDPILMQYTGIVGTGQKAAIDEHDKEALRKLMRENGLSNLAEIEAKRKQLIEISGVK